jgi:uncharacterized protein (DUF1330 family)
MAIKLQKIEAGQGPVFMLNMLKFKDRKVYFDQYLPVFNQVVGQLGIEGVRVSFTGKVVANIVASENESWDGILMVEYPDANAFKTIAESEEYHDLAEPLRLAALEDLKLFMTQRTSL